MFTQKIVDSDAFLDMPLSSQALYFHLNMRADDDGFVNNPKRIQRTIGASEDDLKLLIAKRFLICFENGVVVIKHWRMHNLLRKDRYNPTQYVEQMQTLEIKGNGAYTEKDFDTLQPDGNQMATTWQPDGNQMAHRIGKDRIDKDSIGKKREEESKVQQIADLFNSLCPSLPPVKIISDSIKEDLAESLKKYDFDDFNTLFKKAEQSDFLKGENERSWTASFDWLINADNIAKVLNGKFNNKTSKSKKSSGASYDLEAYERMLNRPDPPTAADDESIRARAEALQQEFAGKK